MTTKYVQYCTRTKLECSAVQNAEVVLCLQDAALLAEVDCPLPSDATYENTFVEATICQFYQPVEGCCPQNYQYTFAYDDAVLADVDTPLQSSDIAGVFCRDCETEYTDYKAGSEVYIRTEEDDTQTLVTQHGCEYPIVAGGGGVCVNEVTTLEFNTAIGAGTLEAGCTYIITDHSQGRVPAGTRVILQAVAGDSVNPQCGVVTSYDSNAWAGWYDVTTNKLLELKDNLGNVCRQFPNPNALDPRTGLPFAALTCVDDFDWGNASYTNCVVDGSIWEMTYGVTADINKVQVLNSSVLVSTNVTYTGVIWDEFTLTGNSYLNVEGPANLINSTVGSTSYIEIGISATPTGTNNGIVNSTVNDALTYNFATNLSFSYYNSLVNSVELELSDNTYFRLWRCLATSNYVYTENLSGTGGYSFTDCVLDSNYFEAVDCTFAININDSSVVASDITGNAVAALGANCNSSNISASTLNFITPIANIAQVGLTLNSGAELNCNGYHSINVYINGALTKTFTAVNVGTGADYFNDNII